MTGEEKKEVSKTHKRKGKGDAFAVPSDGGGPYTVGVWIRSTPFAASNTS